MEKINCPICNSPGFWPNCTDLYSCGTSVKPKHGNLHMQWEKSFRCAALQVANLEAYILELEQGMEWERW